MKILVWFITVVMTGILTNILSSHDGFSCAWSIIMIWAPLVTGISTSIASAFLFNDIYVAYDYPLNGLNKVKVI